MELLPPSPKSHCQEVIGDEKVDISAKETSNGKHPATAELTINSAIGFAKTLTNPTATVEFENELFDAVSVTLYIQGLEYIVTGFF